MAPRQVCITSGQVTDPRYDQYLALSQTFINQWLALLFKYYSVALTEVNLEAPTGFSIYAVLSDTHLEVRHEGMFFYVRFQQGSMNIPSDDLNLPLQQEITGWELAFESQMISNSRFEPVPEDYTIERLYTILSSPMWNAWTDASANLSTFGQDQSSGQPISWSTWKATYPGWDVHLMKSFNSDWRNMQAAKGLNLFGSKFQFSAPKDLNLIPTSFRKYHSILVNHLYSSSLSFTRAAKEQAAPIAAYQTCALYKPPTVNTAPPGDNCFLYCEMILDKLPLPPEPTISGNWVPAGTNGTLILNRRVLFEKALLGSVNEAFSADYPSWTTDNPAAPTMYTGHQTASGFSSTWREESPVTFTFTVDAKVQWTPLTNKATVTRTWSMDYSMEIDEPPYTTDLIMGPYLYSSEITIGLDGQGGLTTTFVNTTPAQNPQLVTSDSSQWPSVPESGQLANLGQVFGRWKIYSPYGPDNPPYTFELPGSGQLTYKAPLFTTTGDLIVEVDQNLGIQWEKDPLENPIPEP